MDVSDKNDDVDSKSRPTFGVRHIQVLMLFLGMMVAFAMRVNMSMAIVAMTDSNKENSFNWSTQTQSVILSSFFWGYVVLQIPAGEIAARIGGKTPIIICIGINSLISLLLPLGAHYGGWQLVCTCRVIQGLSQGLLWPSTHNILGKWSPLEEKSRLGTLTYAGAQLGTALQLMVAGYIAEYLGWPWIFYSVGILGAAWTIAYLFIGAASPKESKLISDQERDYIENSLGTAGEQKRLPTPWGKIMTSLSFIALILAHCGQNWGFWTLMTEMPSYMSQVLGVDIKANGLMSALPYVAMYLMSFPFGFLSDYALKKKWLSVTAVRKISNTIGHWGPALALIGLSYVPSGDITLAVTLLTLTVGLNAGQYTGYLLVHIDMAPNFAGEMMGITNFCANLISIMAPLVAGLLLDDETSAADWRKVFFLSSAVYIFCNLFYLIFGTSERQTWNEPKETEDINDDSRQNKTEKVV